MSAPFTPATAKRWMRREAKEYRDGETGEINCTALAEGCAAAFDVNDVGGPLDDETHWIWDLAVDCANEVQP